MNLSEFEKSSNMFMGIEGGATQSKMAIINKESLIVFESVTGGINISSGCFEQSIDKLVLWIRQAKASVGLVAPLKAVFMGIAGAETEDSNDAICSYLGNNHADLASRFFLTSDSLLSLRCVSKQGVVLVAGTGSSCRLQKKDGSIHGVGGWGHLIGDSGSGYWISNQVMRQIFDIADGFADDSQPKEVAEQLLLKHFAISDKSEILSILYANFDKSLIASFTETLSREGHSDGLIRSVFSDAGKILARHINSISTHFDPEMFSNVPVVIIGSVWLSWSLLKEGFIEELSRNGKIKMITFYEPGPISVGAAMLAAQTCGHPLNGHETCTVFDTIVLNP